MLVKVVFVHIKWRLTHGLASSSGPNCVFSLVAHVLAVLEFESLHGLSMYALRC